MEEFWCAEPWAYAAAIEHRIRCEKREDFRAGLVASHIANLFRGQEEERTHPLDYFPQHQRETETYEFRIERRRKAVAQLNALKFKAIQNARAKKGNQDDG